MNSIVMFLVTFAASAIRGWIFSLVWLWFAVPLGARPVSILHGMGILVSLGIVKGYTPGSKTEIKVSDVLNQVAFAFIGLALAYGIHLAM